MIETSAKVDSAAGLRRQLDAFFRPRSIAVIGATPKAGKVGHTVLENLRAFEGPVYPVNGKYPEILGFKSVARISDIDDEVELAVIITPAATVPELIAECGEKGVRAAVIISAGFRECGEEGRELERRVLGEAARKGIRIIGPNCLGIMNPHTNLNATFAGDMAIPGRVALLSQSGAICTALLDWSLRENVGFSAFVSTGSMLDVGWGDLIQYFGDDAKTNCIVLYMESVGDSRAFLSAAREISLKKPVIVLKAGRSEEAAKATASHTGSLAGSDDVLDAAFRRAGLLRVNNISDIFYMTEVLGKQPRPRGRRLMIVTNAGGPGVLATDSLMNYGGELAQLSEESRSALDKILPPHWSHGNPVDVLGDADVDRYSKAVAIASKDANADGLLVILTPQGMTNPTDIARSLVPFAKSGKPVLASWMGEATTREGEDILNQAGIPTFPYPDTAAKAFLYMWQYNRNLELLYETPSTVPSSEDEAAAGQMLQAIRAGGRTLLTEDESKRLLSQYGIPITRTVVALREDDAVKAAEAVGYPVVVKLRSETITHKTDVNGVKLNLNNADSVRRAWQDIRSAVRPDDFGGVTVQPMVKGDYELIIGSSTDAQFGPVLMFGMGGQLVEVYKDRALALPPLNTTLARRLMEQTKIYEALKGVRGRRPVDLAALEQLLVRFSRIVSRNRVIKEIEINPLLVSSTQMIALDARVILHEPGLKELPQLSIRPYPHKYESQWTMRNGARALMRPIRPEDEPRLIEFHRTLSEHSVYMRYFMPMTLAQRTAHERLTRVCFIDYDREMALLAVGPDEEIMGVARLIRQSGVPSAEFALVVSDKHQRHGVGTELLKRLMQVARDEGVEQLDSFIHPENSGMQELCRKLGFTVTYNPGEQLMEARLNLGEKE